MNGQNNIYDFDGNGQGKNPFKVPEGYFETFEDRLMANIRYQKEISLGKNPKIRILRPIIGLAAAFAGIFLLVYVPMKTFFPNYQAKNAADTTQTTTVMEEYLMTNLTCINGSAFYSAITQEDSNAGSLNNNDVIDYMASDFNDYDIYAEIK
jgi:hypothetical protein